MIFKHGSHASESPDRPQTLGTAQKEVKFTRQSQIKLKQLSLYFTTLQARYRVLGGANTFTLLII